jgi:4-azaleucine resistance transporter AzlC
MKRKNRAWATRVLRAPNSAFRNGLRGVGRAFPIALGYIPIGFAYGVLAQKAGLSAFNTLAMSLFVYAGSSQLIAVGMFALSANPLSVVLTTFIVNLRHMLMASAVAPYLKCWRKWELAIFAYELTDETFAVHAAEFPRGQPAQAETLALNLAAQFSWVCGSWAGLAAGELITDVKPLALDYALPAMFIALLVMQIRDHTQIVVAVFSGALAVGLLLAGMSQWHVIAATIVGATFGAILEAWSKKPFS